MPDKEREGVSKGSHEEKDTNQDHPKGHQHDQDPMPSPVRGAAHRRRRSGQKVGNP